MKTTDTMAEVRHATILQKLTRHTVLGPCNKRHMQGHSCWLVAQYLASMPARDHPSTC